MSANSHKRTYTETLRHLYNREIFNLNRSDALAEWYQLAA